MNEIPTGRTNTEAIFTEIANLHPTRGYITGKSK